MDVGRYIPIRPVYNFEVLPTPGSPRPLSGKLSDNPDDTTKLHPKQVLLNPGKESTNIFGDCCWCYHCC